MEVDIRGMPKKNFGYSIAELLVTLFIVGIITTLALANYRAGQNSAILRQTTAEMVNTLRDAQQHALSATCPAPCGPTDPKPSGYVVYFDESDIHYEIFADLNDDGFYDANEARFVEPPSERLLNVGYRIKLAGSADCSDINRNNASIAFTPPLPQTSIRTKDSSGTIYDCTRACIFNSLGGQTWRITVDKASGLIESSIVSSETCT